MAAGFMRRAALAAAFLLFPHAAGAEVFKTTLNEMAPDWTVNLRCVHSEYNMTIPIPERWKVTRFTLTFPFINSTNLIKEKSSIVVKFNDIPLAHAQLDPANPEGRVTMTAPPALVKSDYNRLTLVGVQHYTENCEHPCAPDLWTTINFEEAELEIEYEYKPVPLQLSSMSPFLFDPKTLPSGAVHLITPGEDEQSLTLASIVASGVARKFDYRRADFTISRERRPGVDNILVADKAVVEEFFRRNGLEPPAITGPFIKVMPLPLDPSDSASPEAEGTPLEPRKFMMSPAAPGGAEAQPPDDSAPLTPRFDAARALVVVSGQTAEHVKIAATTLASMTFPYPGSAETTIKEFRLPEITIHSGKNMLLSDKVIRLSVIGLETHSFHGLQAPPRNLTFRLPPDFYIKENQYARLTLNFAYGAGMRPDSVLNILLNGIHVRSINVDNPSGASIEGYKIEIPTYLFQPGLNTLSLAPILTPQARECDLIQPESLFLTIFDNSTIYFPTMTHFVELPNLGLFMLNGFPFTRWPDGYESLFYITRNDPALLTAALNIIGMISQRNGYPLLGIKVSLERPASWNGDLLVIGDLDSIPEEIRKAAPLPILKETKVKYPITDNLGGEVVFAETRQIGGLKPDAGLVMEMESPLQKGRAAVLLTGLTPGDVLKLSESLLKPGAQQAVDGDLAIIEYDTPFDRISTQASAPKFFVGKYGTVTYFDYFFHYFPKAYYFVLLGGALVSTIMMYLFFRRHGMKRLRMSGGGAAKTGRNWVAWLFLKQRGKKDDDAK